MVLRVLVVGLMGCGVMVGQKTSATAAPAKTALTIYNQDFAVVRSPVVLDLKAGTTEVLDTNVTSTVEPDSVVLRDPAGKRLIHVLEQNYEGSLHVQAQMLAKFEGQTIDFVVPGLNGEQKIVQGKVVRAGASTQLDYRNQWGQNYYTPQPAMEPLIEMDGKMRYGLPGTPLFPVSEPGPTLKPTLRWLIASDKAAKVDAELDYISHGLRWEATYNVIAPAEASMAAEKLEMIGWVDVVNESGKDFRDASLQLMAGDISKLVNQNNRGMMAGMAGSMDSLATLSDNSGGQRQISQKDFDDYHLYDLHRTTDLMDHQSKQIEFLNVADINADRVYVYDGFKIENQQNGMRYLQTMQENFGGGTSTNKKVWIMQEFKNSEANHLGMPLPKGRMRFYRRDADGSLQFIGENTIDHTPKDESVKVFLGDAFDVTGDRTRMDFKTKQNGGDRTITETYKIVLKNAKSSAAQVRVVEHMYRTANWEISKNSDEFAKKDSQTMEFNVDVPAGGEKDVTYTVTYTW